MFIVPNAMHNNIQIYNSVFVGVDTFWLSVMYVTSRGHFFFNWTFVFEWYVIRLVLNTKMIRVTM